MSNPFSNLETVPEESIGEWAVRTWTALTVLIASPDFERADVDRAIKALVESAPAKIQTAGSIFGMSLIQAIEDGTINPEDFK